MTVAESGQSPAETYRLSARDRTGLLMGLGFTQLAVVGVAVIVGSVSAARGGLLMVLLPVCVVGVVVAVVRFRGRPLVELLGPLTGYLADGLATRRRWRAKLDLLGSGATRPQFPPAMAGLVLREVAGGRGRLVALVEDQRDGTLSLTMRVSGRRFALSTDGEQGRMLEQWAQALAPFCREGGPVVGVTWAEWTAPTRIETHRAWMARAFAADADPAALSAYEDVLAMTGAQTARHEVTVTVTVSIARAGRRPGDHRHTDTVGTGRKGKPAGGAAGRLEQAAQVLLREVELFSNRLSEAGLDAAEPFDGAEQSRVLRERLDPAAAYRLDERDRSLGDVAGVVSVANAGPLACEVGRTWWRTDGSVHRAMLVSEWPRTSVYADWLGSFLLDTGGVRTVAVCYRPMSPRESSRRVRHQSVQLESDEQLKREKGILITGEHRRNKDNLDRREQQLLDGHVEFTFCGIVVVSAADLYALEVATGEVVASAARCRMELRPLDWQHDQAVVCALPIGRRPKGASA